MSSPIRLLLDEEFLYVDTISLETENCKYAKRNDFVLFDTGDCVDLNFCVHRVTGEPLCIELDSFKAKTESTIQELRECPLPWTFRIDSLGIEAKPLDEVFQALWDRYKDIELDWGRSDQDS